MMEKWNIQNKMSYQNYVSTVTWPSELYNCMYLVILACRSPALEFFTPGELASCQNYFGSLKKSGKVLDTFLKKNWPTLGLCRSLVLVFYCPDVNVIWGNRRKIYLFYIIAHGLNDFFVYSQSHRQISQILLFWPNVLVFWVGACQFIY